jgi:hypothetical protein
MAAATVTPAAITATTVVVPTNRKKGGVKAKPKARGGGSFQAMRNRVRREKAGFFMGD